MAGINVIDLASVRIQFGLPKTAKHERCKHLNMVYNSDDRRVWCDDCQRTIENFEAFKVIVEHFQKMQSAINEKMRRAQEALTVTLNRRASKEIDRVWSGSTMAICCPHCKHGLLPEDFASGYHSAVSRDWEIARRKKAAEPK